MYKRTLMLFSVLIAISILLAGCSIPVIKLEKTIEDNSKLFDNVDAFISKVKSNLSIPSNAIVSYNLGTPTKVNADLETVFITFSENNQTVASAYCNTFNGDLVSSIKMYSSPVKSQVQQQVTPEPQTPVTTPKSGYNVIKSNATWIEANRMAKNAGGHLVHIDSSSELQYVSSLAASAGINVFWTGGYRTSSSWADAIWSNGSPITYTNWYNGEPSYISEQGTSENYLMVFKVNNKWYYNDGPNDISYAYKGKMGYIIEYGN